MSIVVQELRNKAAMDVGLNSWRLELRNISIFMCRTRSGSRGQLGGVETDLGILGGPDVAVSENEELRTKEKAVNKTKVENERF